MTPKKASVGSKNAKEIPKTGNLPRKWNKDKGKEPSLLKKDLQLEPQEKKGERPPSAADSARNEFPHRKKKEKVIALPEKGKKKNDFSSSSEGKLKKRGKIK